MNAPLWAQRIITEVCEEEGIEEPEVNWRHKTGRMAFSPYSSGHANENRLTLTAGADRKDQRLILLHELSHVIRGAKARSYKHDADFYAKMFELVWRYGPSIGYAKSRERTYKPRGMKAGYRLYRQNVKEKGR